MHEHTMRASRIFIALAAVWLLTWLAMWGAYSWDPLRSFIAFENIAEVSRPFARHPVAPLIIAAAYWCSVFVVFPRAILTLPAVVVFGPWLTFFGGMSGLILGALCGFWIGRKLTDAKVQNLTRMPVLVRLEEKLRHGGVGGVVVVRLVPVAPFTVVNMFLGVLHVHTGDFVLGTFFGLLPGFSFSIFIGDRVRTMLHQGVGNLFLLAIQAIGAGVVLFLLWRMASAKLKEKEMS
jgi:phospholipase D1/2